MKKEEAEGNEITLGDAIHLKHELNKSITYKGLNAREVIELQSLSKDDSIKIGTDYRKWVESMRTLPNWGLAILFFGGVVFMWMFDGWLRWTLGCLAFYAGYSLVKRGSHTEGYVDGYVEGHTQGVNKALGIGDKENADIHHRAIEMEMDEDIVQGLKEK